MFEFIGIVVVLWIVYSILKGVFRGASRSRSREFGAEARYIATKSLMVPESYFNYKTINDIEGLKDLALNLREIKYKGRGPSWPRLLAFAVYIEFQHDCMRWRKGSPVIEKLFSMLNVDEALITEVLDRDPEEVLAAHS